MARIHLVSHQQVPNSPLAQLWHAFSKKHSAIAGLVLFLMFTLIAIIAPLISPHDAYLQNEALLLIAPSWSEHGVVHYLFGTDDLGRDLFSRLLVGTRYTFGLAILTVIGALIVGLILGILAGMSKGIKSSVLNHLLDLALTIPSLLLAIIIVAILGPGLTNTVWATMLAILPPFVHNIRNAISEQLSQDYVTAYRLDGANDWQVLLKVILPNLREPLTVTAALGLSTAILDIAALGFLGLGAQPPSAEWGAIMADSLDLIYITPVGVILPGLLIFAAVLSVNLVGDGLRVAMRSRQDN